MSSRTEDKKRGLPRGKKKTYLQKYFHLPTNVLGPTYEHTWDLPDFFPAPTCPKKMQARYVYNPGLKKINAG